MHAPQLIFVALLGLGLGVSLLRDKGREFPATLAATCIQLGLLYWGGFFG